MNSRAGLKVLLIGDSAVVCRALNRLLKTEPRIQHLLTASDAAEGYSLFKVFRPDAVLLNLELPDMPGLELLKRIKHVSPSCAVIILTASDSPEIREACLRDEADSFLNKKSESKLFTVARAIPALCRSARARSRSAMPRKNQHNPTPEELPPATL
jgi:DNA-binding NarL/FixJ family response regulator